MHEARSKDELYRKIYHEPEGNIGVLRVKLMHSPLFFLFKKQTLYIFKEVLALTITKRDGRKVEFDRNKIISAIKKAFDSVGEPYGDIPESIALAIENSYKFRSTVATVEDIQDEVEYALMGYPTKRNVAKAYMNYRYLHNMARDRYSDLMNTVSEKLGAKNVQNQNANVDEKSFGGRMGEATRVLTKDYAINYILSDMARNNHLNNRIYIHDLDNYAVGNHNCLSIPFDDLLSKGFNTRQTDVRPAKSVGTAFQLVAVIFQLQSLQQFGGVSSTHLDWTMVPYVRMSFYKHYLNGLKYIEGIENYDIMPDNDVISTSIADEFYKLYPKSYRYAMDMTTKEVHQAVEGMYHNLNTLQSRSGNQLPFTSANYGTCTLPEGRLVTKELLEVLIDGNGKLHRTSIFPCGIFQLMKGVNRKPGDPNYDLYRLALRATAQRLYPNYANVDWSGNAGYDINDPRTYFSTMGKRKLQLM